MGGVFGVLGRAGTSEVHIAPRCLPGQQVADEKTCIQFSIRRPKLPSSETHPEEGVYKRLDVAAWLHHLNELGQVEEEYKLRKVSQPAGRGEGGGGRHRRAASPGGRGAARAAV